MCSLKGKYGIGLIGRERNLRTELTEYIIHHSALDCTGNSLFQEGVTELGTQQSKTKPRKSRQLKLEYFKDRLI